MYLIVSVFRLRKQLALRCLLRDRAWFALVAALVDPDGLLAKAPSTAFLGPMPATQWYRSGRVAHPLLPDYG